MPFDNLQPLLDALGLNHQGQQMEAVESFVMKSLLQSIRPSVSIEIGTGTGGSLGLLSRYSEKVYTFDISPDPARQLASSFENVEFITGDSREKLPVVLERIGTSGERLEFVLIDGDHSEKGVRADIAAVLKYEPRTPVYILMHDSFFPPCRVGIPSADWSGSSYVHSVEIDFVPGIFHPRKDIFREMWGGFAIAVMRPEARKGSLEINSRQELLFRSVLAVSAHSPTEHR